MANGAFSVCRYLPDPRYGVVARRGVQPKGTVVQSAVTSGVAAVAVPGLALVAVGGGVWWLRGVPGPGAQHH